MCAGKGWEALGAALAPRLGLAGAEMKGGVCALFAIAGVNVAYWQADSACGPGRARPAPAAVADTHTASAAASSSAREAALAAREAALMAREAALREQQERLNALRAAVERQRG